MEAQKLVPSDRPYANLRWILGVERSVPQDPLALESRTIEIVALWLQDLAHEIDLRPAAPPTSGIGASLRVPGARSLRAATQRFLVAFGYPAGALVREY